VRVPQDFSDFSNDIREISKERLFSTSRDFTFTVQVQMDNSILIEHQSGKRERIDNELLEAAWIRLRDRILSIDSFSDAKSQRLKSYLFPILSELPYVRSVMSRSLAENASRAEALFIDRDWVAPYRPAVSEPSQGWLFQ
jgi:hypothetical protein